MRPRFYLRSSQSPTYFNLDRYLKELGWRSTRFKWRAKFSEGHFQFDTPAAEQLEFKHLLAQLIAHYCPQVMPTSHVINDENWPGVLNTLAHKYYMQDQGLADQVDNLAWILKPSLLNNGQHIKIFSTLSQIEQHYLSNQRLGGPHILQHYIAQPHLLKGHKYNIRMFVVMTNYAGAYLYPHGYFNVALHPYQANQYLDLNSHLTNEHLHEAEANVVQIPTQRFEIFPDIYRQIKILVRDTINSLQQLHPQAFVCKKDRSLAIFGFDFMVDAAMRVWLLEANHGPCFPTSDEHLLQRYLYHDFWQALIASFVVPIAQQQKLEQIQYPYFETCS